MPIATPEVYADMLDRAKAGSFAYPAINVSRAADAERRAPGLRRRRLRRHHPGLDRWRRLPLRPDHQEHGDRLARPRGLRATRWPRTTRSTSRCTPTTAPRTSSTASCGRSSRRQHRAGQGRRHCRSSRATCGTARPCRSTRTSRSPQELLALAKAANVILEIEVGVVGGEEDGVEGEIDEQALHDARGRHRHDRGARPRRERPLPDRAHLRQRPRRLQAGQRQAAPRDPPAGPGGRRAKELGLGRRRKPLRPRLPRRLRLAARGDLGRRRLRRRQDERRHRHPVRLHPPGRRLDDLTNYAGVLKVDGEVGNKKQYDPRAWGKAAEDRPWPLASSRPASRAALGGHAPRERQPARHPRDACSPSTRPPRRSTPVSTPVQVAARLPRVLARVGGPRRGRPGRRRPRRRGLRVRPHRLPPGARLAAQVRLARPGPGAVVARAQPRASCARSRRSARAARAIGETDEEDRCTQFLRDSSSAEARARARSVRDGFAPAHDALLLRRRRHAARPPSAPSPTRTVPAHPGGAVGWAPRSCSARSRHAGVPRGPRAALWRRTDCRSSRTTAVSCSAPDRAVVADVPIASRTPGPRTPCARGSTSTRASSPGTTGTPGAPTSGPSARRSITGGRSEPPSRAHDYVSRRPRRHAAAAQGHGDGRRRPSSTSSRRRSPGDPAW